jgi:hypothetical protein
VIPPSAVARARGLQTRLLTRAELVALADAPDLPEALTARGLVPATAREPAAVERALRRNRSEHLTILARWCPPAALPLVFLDEDRRSLVALLRRVHAGRRDLDGLTPTPSLPERALATLAEQEPDGIAALLVGWRHPFGAPLRRAESLAAREQAVHRTFFRRAGRGDRGLRRVVRLMVDAENALALSVGRAQPAAARDPEAWIPGGRHIDKAAYADILEGVRPLEVPGLPEITERGVLVALLTRLRREARIEPLSSAPVLYFAARLRAEALDLRTLVWGRALSEPPAALAARLVTP